ncbi:MAG: hypothetical protein ABSG59_01055 [Verrucomicrobiota bacterium]|jgi:hypothetical protein
MQKKAFKYGVCFGLALTLMGVFAWRGIRLQSKSPLASLDLGDGRVLQLEGVTYGTDHHVGDARSAMLGRFQPWLPRQLAALLAPKYPQTVINHLDRPALVVWVNAIDPTTRTNVDCQRIRVELVDEQGDLFESETGFWYGQSDFWRVGHVFYSFPRTERTLTMQVTSWKSHKTGRMEFPNPGLAQPALWKGDLLPQQQRVGDLSIVLCQLNLRTNGSPKTTFWETKAVYWEPVWELRRGEREVAGWDAPEWMAEDPTGNRSRHLGAHQPLLRFSATFYPSPTNTEAADVIATLPAVTLAQPQPIQWWNQSIHIGTNEIAVLGFFPPGNYVFSDGVFLTNPPVTMGAVGGGAPSGWTGQDVTLTPWKRKSYHGHYSTTNSIIYLRAPALDGKDRLAIRLRDARGVYWLTKPEPQGSSDRIYPYLVELPPEIKSVVPEVVLLKPVEAEFTVKVNYDQSLQEHR